MPCTCGGSKARGATNVPCPTGGSNPLRSARRLPAPLGDYLGDNRDGHRWTAAWIALATQRTQSRRPAPSVGCLESKGSTRTRSRPSRLYHPPVDLDGSLILAEELVQCAYPPQRIARHVGQGMDVSGPGYHIVSLAVSEVFWEESAERWEEVWGRFEAKRVQLVAALATKWGKPHHRTFCADFDRAIRGELLPPLADVLVEFITDADTWYRHGRSVCVGLGQWDKEFPIQLVLAVGELGAPE